MLNSQRNPIWFAAICLAVAAGCAQQIGDECKLLSDCSDNGDRLCLTEEEEQFPGGYCSLFNCDPGGCPEEAICVGYRSHLSEAAECENPFERQRLQRSWCMLSCSSNADCRKGYACIDVSEGNPWGAEVLESPGKSGKICAVEYTEQKPPEEHMAEVCVFRPGRQLDAGLLLTPLAADTDASSPALQRDAAAAPRATDGGVDASVTIDGAAAVTAALVRDASAP